MPTDDALICRIKSAPNESQISGIVVEKALIAKSSVIRIWLIKKVLMPTMMAVDYGHGL